MLNKTEKQDIYQVPFKYGKYYDPNKFEKIKIKPKKRGHRKKKFDNQESVIISFRIAKDLYIKNKEEVRGRINNVIIELYLDYNRENRIRELEKELHRIKNE